MLKCSIEFVIPQIVDICCSIVWACNVKVHLFINMNTTDQTFMITSVLPQLPIRFMRRITRPSNINPNTQISVFTACNDGFLIRSACYYTNSLLVSCQRRRLFLIYSFYWAYYSLSIPKTSSENTSLLIQKK